MRGIIIGLNVFYVTVLWGPVQKTRPLVEEPTLLSFTVSSLRYISLSFEILWTGILFFWEKKLVFVLLPLSSSCGIIVASNKLGKVKGRVNAT